MKFFSIKLQRTRSQRCAPKRSAAFTLVETLVAISVLMVAVASPLTIAQKSLSSALYAKDQTTAFFLAQDAVEYLKYVRLLKSGSGNWVDPAVTPELADCISPAGAAPSKWCTIDTRKNLTESAIATCTSDTCDILTFDSTTKVYGYDTPSTTIKPSLYGRRFTLIPVEGHSEVMRLLIQIRWKFGALGERDITINTLLYNWR